MREQLIGYLLGALDPAEQELVEQALAQSPTLRRDLKQLRSRLDVLSDSDQAEDYDPPRDLTAKTLDSIVGYEEEHKVVPANKMPLGIPSASRWTLTDLVVTAGICIVASLLFFPAIANSRFQARMLDCQNNLRSIANALQAYSERYDNYFPAVPSEGNVSTAGFYAIALSENEFVNDQNVFLCSGAPIDAQRQDWYLPTREEVEQARGGKLVVLRQSMGGSYAYTLGYAPDGTYQPTRNLGRQQFVIMADRPNQRFSAVRSVNHSGRGHNVLYEDSHVKFLAESIDESCHDSFFINRVGLMAPGVDIDDAVVGSSDTSPFACQ